MHFSYTGRATYPRFALLSCLSSILLYDNRAACQNGLETTRVGAINTTAIHYSPSLDVDPGWAVTGTVNHDAEVVGTRQNLSLTFQFVGESAVLLRD